MSRDTQCPVQELTDYTRATYGIDPQAMRVILCALLPADRPIWTCIEAPTQQIWTHLDGYMRKRHRAIGYLPTIRAIRPRYVNPSLQPYLDHRHAPALFLDTSLPTRKPSDRSLYFKLNAECVRVRTALPVMPHPVESTGLTDKIEQVIRYESRTQTPVPIKPPELLRYYLDLLQRINPELGPGAIESACLVPSAHACLHGRDKLTEPDHMALHRVLRDSIRKQMYEIIRVFADQPGAHTLADMRRTVRYSSKVLIGLLDRLDQNGIVDWPQTGGQRKKWIVPLPPMTDLTALINGLGRWW